MGARKMALSTACIGNETSVMHCFFKRIFVFEKKTKKTFHDFTFENGKNQIEKYYMLQLDDFGFATFRALLKLQ